MPKKMAVKSQSQESPAATIPGFGERLAEARRSSGLSQTALGARIGVDLSAVNAWEKSRRPPEGGLVFLRLAGVLGVSIDYLLTGQEPVGIDAIIDGLEALLASARRLRVGAPADSRQALPHLAEEAFEPLPSAGERGAGGG